MAQHYNLVQVESATTGTGTLTLGAAVSGFLTPALAGVLTGTVVEYSIRDGAASEMGIGTYSSTGPTLTRTKILDSTNGGAAINCSGTQQVRFTPSNLGLNETAGMGMSLYLSNTASDIATYKSLPAFVSDTPASIVSAALSAGTSDQLVYAFATDANTPHSHYVHRGLHILHIWASCSVNMSATTLYGKLYRRETDNTETLIATTALLTTEDKGTGTDATIDGTDMTGVFYLYNRNRTTSDEDRETILNITDRLVVKIYANVAAGTGGTVTITQGFSMLQINVDSQYFAERLLAAGATDNQIVRADGVIGKIQASAATVADTTGAINIASGSYSIGGANLAGVDGWIDASGETWTYVSATAPYGVISVNADVTGKYQAGYKFKFTQTTVKYAIVTAVGSYSGGATQITIYTGTDYTLANAAISANYYSLVKAPFGFPLDPSKWTVSVTNSSIVAAGGTTKATWYNPSGHSIIIPVGAWYVYHLVEVQAGWGTNQLSVQIRATLSTANNSASDSGFTDWDYGATGSAALVGRIAALSRQKILVLSSVTTYYQNIYADGDTDPATLQTRGDIALTTILAVCAYL